jgi:hypothetical protein
MPVTYLSGRNYSRRFSGLSTIAYKLAKQQRRHPLELLRIYDLVLNNITRWNSWHDAAARALKLHTAINEFVDYKTANYNAALARYVGSRSLKKRPPKEPSLLTDLLSADD